MRSARCTTEPVRQDITVFTIYDTIQNMLPCDPDPWFRRTCRAVVLHENKMAFSFMSNRDQYVLPGGGIEPGETFATCAERECLEELGLVVRAGEPMGMVREYYDGILRYENIYLQAFWDGTRSTLEQTEEEHLIGITERWLSIEKVQEILQETTAHETQTEDQPGFVKRAIANCHMRELLGISSVTGWSWESIAKMRTKLEGISVHVKVH